MAVQTSSARPFEFVQHIGIAIRELDRSPRPVGLHCGFLYRLDGAGPRLLHFAWHHVLRDEPPSPQYLWADTGLDEPNSRFVAAFASILKTNEHNIPYGLDAEGSCFDKSTGEFIQPPIGKGLTCATFIVAVLRSLGFVLVLTSTWPAREDDDEFGRQTVADLEANRAEREHVDAVRNDIGAKRFRPEEVVAATMYPSSEWPVMFPAAVQLAQEILADLHTARTATA